MGVEFHYVCTPSPRTSDSNSATENSHLRKPPACWCTRNKSSCHVNWWVRRNSGLSI